MKIAEVISKIINTLPVSECGKLQMESIINDYAKEHAKEFLQNHEIIYTDKYIENLYNEWITQ